MIPVDQKLIRHLHTGDVWVAELQDGVMTGISNRVLTDEEIDQYVPGSWEGLLRDEESLRYFRDLDDTGYELVTLNLNAK